MSFPSTPQAREGREPPLSAELRRILAAPFFGVPRYSRMTFSPFLAALA